MCLLDLYFHLFLPVVGIPWALARPVGLTTRDEVPVALHGGVEEGGDGTVGEGHRARVDAELEEEANVGLVGAPLEFSRKTKHGPHAQIRRINPKFALCRKREG